MTNYCAKYNMRYMKHNKIDVRKFGARFRIVQGYSKSYFCAASSRNYYIDTNSRSDDQESRKVDNARFKIILPVVKAQVDSRLVRRRDVDMEIR